jgi:hypothetical protein
VKQRRALFSSSWGYSSSHCRELVREGMNADLVLGRSYSVRGTMTLNVGAGGLSGYWSDPFIEQVFPVRERSQSLTERVRF